MAIKIVFLNLADMDPSGLASKSVQNLRKKHPSYGFVYEFFYGANQIRQVDLFGLLKGEKGKSGVQAISPQLLGGHAMMLPEIARERLAITMLCGAADKIMLGVHGRYDDTEKGFAGMGWGQETGVIGRYKEFAKLTAQFLSPGKSHKLALIVCYGARSENFKKDHEGKLSAQDIRSSFAFKFYKELMKCSKADITMTARTGAVGFDNQGRSIVQTEAAVKAEIADREMQLLKRTHEVNDAYQRLDQACKTIQELETLQQLGQDLVTGRVQPTNAKERVILEYMQIKGKAANYTIAKEQKKKKYGKFIYTTRKGKIEVFRKYDSSGTKVMEQLYSGY